MAESDQNATTSLPTSHSGRRLDSWKEIAAYLSRDVTTVRRWERREGLPVHRHRHATLGSVYAFTNEIDAWQSGRQETHHPEESAPFEDAAGVVVGREREIGQLHAQLQQALGGSRRTVFISGELGIGKTSLVRAFLHAVKDEVWIAAGQCVEQYGRSEPYRPVVESLGRLVRSSPDSDALRIVEDHAPSWLDQLAGSSRGRHRSRAGATAGPGQIAGELTNVIERLAAVKPLVLVLEDLHWSDYSTIEVIARLGRGADRARLLVIGTYRLADLVDVGSPLLRVCRELRAHFQADEIELSFLSQDAIAAFIGRDKKWSDLQGAAARLRHWSGNPLFLVHLLEHLESSGRLSQHNGEWALDLETAGRAFVPDRLRTLVEDQVDRLGPDFRRLLETASVVGSTFAASVVAHAAPEDTTSAERQFEDLCRRSHLVARREAVDLPDGTSSAAYAFVHEFYRQVIYERLPAATVTQLHRAVGMRLEGCFGNRASEIASELATHFERGHDLQRASHHYATAAENALARNADREAHVALSRAAELVARLSQENERDREEQRLLALLDVVFARLSRDTPWITSGATGQILPSRDKPSTLIDSIVGLSTFHAVSGDLRAARDIGDRAMAIGRARRSALSEVTAQSALVRLLAGEFSSSLALATEALTFDERSETPRALQHRSRCLLIVAWSLWCLGRYDQVRATLERALSVTGEHHRTATGSWIAPLLEWLGETDRSLAMFESAAAKAPTLSHDGILSGDVVHGWLLVRRHRIAKGLVSLREGSRAQQDLGLHASLPLTMAWLAEGLSLNRRANDARAAAEEGLQVVRRTGVRWWDSELYRLRGEALIAPRSSAGRSNNTKRDTDAAEASFWAAITVAREQDARTLELRATLSLSRLLRDAGRDEEATRTLASLSETFEKSAITPDLTEARLLIDARK